MSERDAIRGDGEVESAKVVSPASRKGADQNGTAKPNKFAPIKWENITFDADEEWLVDGILPTAGVGALFGRSKSLKSFIALNLSVHVATGRPWAGRFVKSTPVIYCAAEGQNGFKKRVAGVRLHTPSLPARVNISLIEVAPNLGIEGGDLDELVAAIEGQGVDPGLIVIDTLAKAIGAADENGAGMAALLSNAAALAQRFKCLVLLLHHVGHGEDAQKRLRGHSNLPAALDVSILSERDDNDLLVTLTIQKEKDEADGFQLEARLERVVIDHDKRGNEVSTLIVESMTEADSITAEKPRSKKIPSSLKTLVRVVADAIDEAGEDHYVPNGLKVRAAADSHIRDRYYTRIAEKAAPGETKKALAERQRKSFNRAIKSAIDTEILAAVDRTGERIIWLL